jgi:hypothetical protein
MRAIDKPGRRGTISCLGPSERPAARARDTRPVPDPAIQHHFHSSEFLAIIFQTHGLFPFVVKFGRKRVGQVIRDELLSAGRVEVRQIAARVPAFKTLPLNLMMPLPLLGHDLPRKLRFHGERSFKCGHLERGEPSRNEDSRRAAAAIPVRSLHRQTRLGRLNHRQAALAGFHAQLLR